MAQGPRYTEDEVKLILRRAAELQQRDVQSGDSRNRMSLAEIETAAEEAGIERALVRRAATEVSRPEPRAALAVNPWIGGPLEVVIERTIDGEYPIEDFDRLVEVVRVQDFQGGTVATIGRSLNWTGPQEDQTSIASLSVTVRDGQTRLRAHGNFKGLAGAVFGGVGGGVGGGLGWAAFMAGAFVAGPVGSVVLGLAFLGGVFGLSRYIYGRSTVKHARKLQAVADELERVIKGRIAAGNDEGSW